MPQYKNLLERFPRGVPRDFWTQAENRHAFLRWFGAEFGYRRPEDWYRCTRQLLRDARGNGLIKQFRNSLLAILTDFMPEYDWKLWLLDTVPRAYWADPENCRDYLRWLGEQLGFREAEDWYQVIREDFLSHHGRMVLEHFDGSLVDVLGCLYPDREWLEWRFYLVPDGFWEDPACSRRYLEWLGKQLGYTCLEDYYQLQSRDIISNNGSTLSRLYHNSVINILREAFSEHEWLEWRFSKSGDNFWSGDENRRRYFTWLAAELGWTKMEDWYQLTAQHLHSNRGQGLLNHFNGSPLETLKATFPHEDWKEWRFRRVAASFWDDDANCRRYLAWLADRLGFETLEDWYTVTQIDFRDNYGIALINLFHNSNWELVTHFWPEHDWKAWLMSRTPSNYWSHREHRRLYLDWLGEELGYEDMEDWYRVTGRDFYENRGVGLINIYGSSPTAILKDIFSDYDWKEWLFDVCPGKFWGRLENRQRYLAWLGKELGIRRLEDWYEVTYRHFAENKGKSLSYRYDSIAGLMRDHFPDYDWKEWLFKKVPAHFWGDPKNRRRYLAWLGEGLGFEKPSDWCRLTRRDLLKSRGKGLLNTCGSLENVLRYSFPANHPIIQARRKWRA